MVVPFGAGGALDLIARVLADGLRNQLGQTILVDNKPGASGLLAMRLVAGAAPDGYTIILSSESNHILLPLLDSKFPLDVSKEFVPSDQPRPQWTHYNLVGSHNLHHRMQIAFCGKVRLMWVRYNPPEANLDQDAWYLIPANWDVEVRD